MARSAPASGASFCPRRPKLAASNPCSPTALVRDVRQMNAMGYHCFCKGYSPLDSAGRILAKTINQPITCGGVQVHPGDFILADYDGVAVIPAAIKGEVHKKAMEKLAGENVVRDELAAGQSPREVFDRYGIL